MQLVHDVTHGKYILDKFLTNILNSFLLESHHPPSKPHINLYLQTAPPTPPVLLTIVAVLFIRSLIFARNTSHSFGRLWQHTAGARSTQLRMILMWLMRISCLSLKVLLKCAFPSKLLLFANLTPGLSPSWLRVFCFSATTCTTGVRLLRLTHFHSKSGRL